MNLKELSNKSFVDYLSNGGLNLECSTELLRRLEGGKKAIEAINNIELLSDPDFSDFSKLEMCCMNLMQIHNACYQAKKVNDTTKTIGV
jgi:hypothetical protein